VNHSPNCFEQSLKTSKIAPGGLIVGEVMRIENDFVVVTPD